MIDADSTGRRAMGRRARRSVVVLAAAPVVRRLTEREHQVARLVADGLKDTVIARRLGLASSTVGTHIQHILERLDLASRADIAAWVQARRAHTIPHPV
jgi:DNA-binding NarL/FixJ family response regulator